MASATECSRLVLEAVKENSVSKLRLVTRTCEYKKNEKLESVLQCNVDGETPLGIAMRMENEFLIHELVLVLKCSDYTSEENKLFIAIDLLSNQIPILKLMDYLISDFNETTHSTKWLKFISQAFAQSSSFTRHDKIIALELIGASLVINSMNCSRPVDSLTMFGLDCWRKALILRYSPQDGEPLLPKILATQQAVPSEASSVVFGSAVEVMSMEELDALQERFERNYLALDRNVQLSCHKEVKIQALLVIRSICSEGNHLRPYGLYLLCLMTFRSFLNQRIDHNSEDNKLISNICLLVFEQLNGFDPQLISYKSFDLFSKTLGVMSIYYVSMLQAPPNSPGRGELTYANLLAPTKFIATISTYFQSPIEMSLTKWGYGKDDTFAKLVYNFIFVLNSISPQLTIQEKLQLEDCYSNYIRDFFPERTSTVLHAAVLVSSGENSLFSNIYNLETINLIIKLKADLNAIDEFGRTPLFILAFQRKLHHVSSYTFDEYLRIFQTLLDSGSHVDMVTDYGDTVISVLKQILKQPHLFHQNVNLIKKFKSLIDDHDGTVLPLSCLCARVIRQHGIPFDQLPLNLIALVAHHSRRVRIGIRDDPFRSVRYWCFTTSFNDPYLLAYPHLLTLTQYSLEDPKS